MLCLAYKTPRCMSDSEQLCNLHTAQYDAGIQLPYLFHRIFMVLLLTMGFTGAHSKLVLSALPAMAEKHFMHPSCLSCLHFSLTTNSALTLESITQPPV